jgi:hypothetical protein
MDAQEGVALAQESIDGGEAMAKLVGLRGVSRG